MKKYYIVLLLALFMGIESCDNILNDVIPDVSTTLSKSFQIQIYQNSGSSTDQLIDISTSDQYGDFKNIIKGYELSKITYQIKNANVPADMYFSGMIICKNEEGTQIDTVGNISRVKISGIAGSTTETDVTKNLTNITNLLEWLKTSGKFKVVSSYSLTNEQNAPYPIVQNVAGSNFEIIVHFYIVVKTGV